MTTLEREWVFADYNQAESRVVAWKAPVTKLRQWYSEKKDVHAYVCQLIAKVVQENNIQTPINPDTNLPMFRAKHWSEYKKGDYERDIAKRVVHAYNYGMGPEKFALIAKISVQLATILMKIYAVLFPEIKAKYHAWIEKCLRTEKCLWMPEPVKFRKVFHEINPYVPLEEDILRAGYASYPQCIIGALLVRTLNICCNIFVEKSGEVFEPRFELRDQWEAWYGRPNWDKFTSNLARDRHDPQTILWRGMDVRMNIHDAGGISIPPDESLIRWACGVWRDNAEIPITLDPGNVVVIPVDFKRGATMGSEDLHEYKLVGV